MIEMYAQFQHPLDQFDIVAMKNTIARVGLPQIIFIISTITMYGIILSIIIRNSLQFDNYTAKGNAYKKAILIMYIVVRNIIKNNLSLKRYAYFTILFFLFIFIFTSNMLGLIPYSFTLTSSFVITFYLASSHFIGINIIGTFHSQWKIFKIFLASGVPLVIVPFLTIIEVVSYIAKVFSLSIRLFANMMSGHALLKILMGFAWNLLIAGGGYTILAVLPWVVVTLIFYLEATIAYLQAYVFAVLIIIYLSDTVTAH
jgi:ATP synthase subunit 6